LNPFTLQTIIIEIAFQNLRAVDLSTKEVGREGTNFSYRHDETKHVKQEGIWTESYLSDLQMPDISTSDPVCYFELQI
jgi:hypothetical protein